MPPRLEAAVGDITDERVDAIVNAANRQLRGGGAGERETLASCYRSSLAVAEEVGALSVAFPAISTGVYGYPPEQAAEVAVAAVRSTDTAVALVRFIAFDPATLDHYARLLG